MGTVSVIYDLVGRDNVSSAFKSASEAAGNTETAFGRVSKAAAVMGAAIGTAAVAVAVESVKSAVSFQASMEKIHTQAGATQGAVESLTNSVLKMAPSTEQGPQQLADALFHLKSVGLDNADAMTALKTASDLAAVGNSNLEDTTNALAGAWRSGIKGAQTFGQTAATVNAIIGAGNMTMSDLVGALSTGILPAARTFGVSLSSVGAALALMSDEGVPAQDAATRLKMSLSLMAAPSETASKALATIGVTGLQLANTMRGPQGLVGAVALLKSHLDASGLSASQQAILLSQAFGGGRSSSAILTMINNLDVLEKKQKQINDTTGDYGAAVTAQRQTASAQFDLLKSTVDTLGIRLGLDLLPPVTKFTQFLTSTVVPDMEKVAKWLTSPDVKPWAEIGGILAGGAIAALAIYGSLQKALQLTGLGDLIASFKESKNPVSTAAETASANMGTAADTMLEASLNMLKAAGIEKDATGAGAAGAGAAGAGEATTTAEDTAIGMSVGAWLKTAAGAAVITLIVGNVAGTVAKKVHPVSSKTVHQYQSAVPGPVQGVANTIFGGPTGVTSLLEPVWSPGAPRGMAAPAKDKGSEPAPKSKDYTAYQNHLSSSKSSPVDRAWSTSYEDFQRDFAGRITAWFTESLPHAYDASNAVLAKVWSTSYEDFQRDFAGKLTSWFTVSLPHAFEVGGSVAAHALATGFDDGKHWVLSAADAVEGWITSPFDKAASWLENAGESIVDGLVNGIESNAGSVASALLHLIPSPIRSTVSKVLGWAGFAGGTAFAPAGWHWVGERGPELLKFAGGEKVLPHLASMSAARSAIQSTSLLLGAGEAIPGATAAGLSADDIRALLAELNTGSGGGGEFTGTLYLDSGELIGIVQGEIKKDEKATLRAARSGSGSRR